MISRSTYTRSISCEGWPLSSSSFTTTNISITLHLAHLHLGLSGPPFHLQLVIIYVVAYYGIAIDYGHTSTVVMFLVIVIVISIPTFYFFGRPGILSRPLHPAAENYRPCADLNGRPKRHRDCHGYYAERSGGRLLGMFSVEGRPMLRTTLVSIVIALLWSAADHLVAAQGQSVRRGGVPASQQVTCDIGPPATVPIEAAAAGLTHCVANFDFSQPTYAVPAYNPTRVASSWANCFGENSGIAGIVWHGGSGGIPAVSPCDIKQKVDGLDGST